MIVSLDEPVRGLEDGNLTMGDSIEDETAAQAMEQPLEDWQLEQLRACLDDCLCDLQPDQAQVVRARYMENKTLQAIADETGSTRDSVRQLEAKGLRRLRHPLNSQRLGGFMEAADCHGYGLASFSNRGYVSKVEVLAGTV